MLLGRDTELAHIDSLLGDARAAHRRVLGLVGTPGVGKTALCAYAVEQAPDMRVIRLRGALAEVELPLVGLADVVAALSDFVEFVPQKERALLVALKGRDANPEMDPMALGAATLSLLGTAADATPLLVVVDDAHWVDVPSLHALVFAWRRLDHDAVAVLVTARPPLPDALGAVVELIELAGLDVDSALDLVQGASTHHIAVDVARQLALLTGGNPLALSELPALLTRAQLNGAEPLPVPLPIGPRAVISLRALLGSLPRSTCLALAVVATAGPKGTQYLAPALEQLGLTTDDLAEAERAQLLTTIEGELTFRHGLVGTAAIDLVGPAQHRRIHSALAGAAALVDFERSVAHRYAAMLGTSEEIAKALDVVADSARQRGGAAASAPVLERAARASPPGPSRWARILRAVEAALIAGHPGNVRDLCEQLRAECDDATARGAATLLLGQSATWGEAPPGLKEDLWKLAKDANVAVSVPALMTLANMGLGRGDMPGLDEAVRALREVDISSAPHMSLHVDVFKAIGDTFCGNRETARALIERVAEIEAAPHTGPHGLAELTAETLNHVEEYETARALTTRSVQLARSRGAVFPLPFQLASLADSCWWLGDWHRTIAYSAEAVVLADQTGQRVMGGYARGLLARARAGRGETGEVLAHATVLHKLADEFQAEPLRVYAAHAVGLCALGNGNYEQALPVLRLAYRLRTKLAPSLYTITPDVGDFAEALVRTGALAEARSVLEQLDDNAGRLQSPFVDIVSARIHGLLEPTNYESWFERALSVASAPLAFEKARTRLALAQRLRRERRNSDAQPQLALALEAFDKLGAQVWAARASAELRALRSNVGRRPTAHRIDALTPQELHVCLTVAEGMTNREVASALFLSPKTVETHLGRAFRKLGLTSRSQLVRMVAERAGDEVHRH